MSRRRTPAPPAEEEAEAKKPELPPYGLVEPFGDASVGVYHDNKWVMVPVEPRRQKEPSLRMFWAAATPYEPKLKKKRRKKKK